MASVEAVDRRRRARRMTTEWKRQKAERRRKRELKEQETAKRMVRRFYRHTHVYLIVFEYRYWLARRCGWDACRVEFRRRDDGTICEPEDSDFWTWWASLHYEQREKFVELSKSKRR